MQQMISGNTKRKKEKIGMQIYLAGNCGKEMRPLMVSIAEYIRKIKLTSKEKINVYCPFELQIDEKDEHGNWKMTQEGWGTKVFLFDEDAIRKCDLFLMISEGRISSAGTNFELGLAYGLKKRTSVIQITREDTSLMTWGGSTDFINLREPICLYLPTKKQIFDNQRELYESALKILKEKITTIILNAYRNGDPIKDICLTHLT